MKYLPAILLFVFLCCGQKKNSGFQVKDSVKVDSTIENESVMRNIDSVHRNYGVDYISELPLHAAISCQNLCDEERGINLDRRVIKKNGVHKAFDLKQTKSRDSLKISFDFIADCGMSFRGEARSENDTLILSFKRADIAGADCYCDYRMRYRISKLKKNWHTIKIEKGDTNTSEVIW